jgi:ubiquinol-cytochrome c reductase cytochrome b subunit
MREKQPQSVIEYLALEGIIARLREIEVSADAISWSRFFGALLLALLILLFLSGAVMTFYYSPVPGAAYDSVDFALFTLPFGDIVKGIHHYSWNLLLMVMGLQLLRSFFLGAYKAPRQLVWLTGVMIMLVIPLFIITGDLLPWDQKGYWSTQVRLSIMGSVPLVGDFMIRLLQGGPLTGIVALTRFYVLHILFLPCLLILLLNLHFHFLSHSGLSGRISNGKKSPPKMPLFPNMINRWLVLFLLTTVVMGFVSRFWIAPLGDPADPTDSSYIPKPEWWVLFLNQLVSIFKGPFSVLGTVIVPGGLAILMMALPFVDPSPERRPTRRLKVIIPAAIILVFIIGLSVSGYMEHFGAVSE